MTTSDPIIVPTLGDDYRELLAGATPEQERYMRLNGPIHNWFELTYAKYLTIPRSILQSMPVEWQIRFVQCLDQLDSALPEWRPQEGRYWVKLKDADGRYVSDPFDDYRHTPVYSAKDVARLRGADVFPEPTRPTASSEGPHA